MATTTTCDKCKIEKEDTNEWLQVRCNGISSELKNIFPKHVVLTSLDLCPVCAKIVIEKLDEGLQS